MKKEFVLKRAFGASCFWLFLMLFLPGCTPQLDLAERDTSNLSVPQLIHLRSNAIDPDKKWRTASSYCMRTKFSSTDNKTKEYYGQEILYKAPKRFKMTTYKNGKPENVIISNEGRIWKVNPVNNRSTLLKPESLEYKLIAMTTRMADPTLEYSDIFPKISIDMFTRDGKRFYRLICHPNLAEVAPYIFYINGTTYLTEKLETIQYQKDSPMGLLYSCETSKYITVSKVKVAEETIISIQDGWGDTLVTRKGNLEEMKINPNIPETEFLPPIPFTHQAERAVLPK